MKTHFTLIFCLFSVFSFAQTNVLPVAEQEKIINKIVSSKDSIQNQSNSFDRLLFSGKITDPEQIASIYSYKAAIMWELNASKIVDYTKGQKDSNTRKAIDEIFYLYQIAIDTAPFYAPINLVKKYEFEESLGKEYKELAKKDYLYLKSKGYKRTYSGIGIGICYNHNSISSKSIGVEASLFSILQRGYTLKNIDIEKKRKIKLTGYYVPYSFSILSFNFHKDLCRPRYEFWASALPISVAFTYLNFTKIGFIGKSSIETKPLWCYRPELGISVNGLAFYLSANVLFKKEYRKNANELFLCFKYIRPIKVGSN